MSDVLFYHTPDGGEIDVLTGGADVVTTDTPSSALYIALFGGSSAGEWWGNLVGNDPLKSRLLQLWESGAAITPANLSRYREAVAQDLADFDVESIEVSIVGPKRIEIAVNGNVVYSGNMVV